MKDRYKRADKIALIVKENQRTCNGWFPDMLWTCEVFGESTPDISLRRVINLVPELDEIQLKWDAYKGWYITLK